MELIFLTDTGGITMKRDEYFITAEAYRLLELKYLRLKEEIENFLKKKSGYKDLREILKDISS
jgi:hypothetical protein